MAKFIYNYFKYLTIKLPLYKVLYKYILVYPFGPKKI